VTGSSPSPAAGCPGHLGSALVPPALLPAWGAPYPAPRLHLGTPAGNPALSLGRAEPFCKGSGRCPLFQLQGGAGKPVGLQIFRSRRTPGDGRVRMLLRAGCAPTERGDGTFSSLTCPCCCRRWRTASCITT